MNATRALVPCTVAAALLACGGGASVSSPQSASVGIAPKAITVGFGAQVQFGAAVGGSSDRAVAWTAPDCGSVTDAGRFTAPAAAATCRVVATSRSDPTKSATATVTVAASGGAQAWRPFSASSPWNTPIPPNPPLHANSAALVAAFASSSPWGPHLDVNIAGYSIPLYWADASTPALPVRVVNGGDGWGGSPATASMPIPPGAAPDPQSDHHMLVISADRTIEYGCWDVSWSASASPPWQAGVCATADLTGTGVRPPIGQANPWWHAAGARACGFPLVAGLIRVEEIQAGRIDHALVIAYPGIQKSQFLSPASFPSGSGAAVGVPCGGRFQYDPSVDPGSLGLSRAGQIIVRALQEYGAYVGDYSGALSLYAENSPEAQAYWSTGVLGTYELQNELDLSRLRVLQYGTLY